jgi:murein DD-endopeptidase MepM/ murein hydrolase activator NlpD
MHLSRILVQPGERVSQGDRIGLVGQTGLATGPHLDFRIIQHGNYRNFEALRLPPALPVAKSDWGEFVAARDRYLAQLPPLPGAPVLARQQPADPNRPASSSAP